MRFLKRVARQYPEFDIVFDVNQRSKKARRQLPYTIEAPTKIAK
jgi:hypothetical protein